jgi:NADH-quinone oxidoreductase subunit N
MKWFVQGSIATAMLIIGIAVIISRTDGLLSFAAVRAADAAPQASVPLATGLILVLSVLAFKAGAFPFHSWMPDAFETAPPAASAVLASAGKIGPIAVAVWLASSAVGATGDRMLGVVALVSVASIVFGNLAALRQVSLARMLAYSAIAQVGYALAALPLVQGRASVLVFAGLYALASAGAFLFIVALRAVEPAWDGSIAGLAGLSARRPALAVSLVPLMLSLTGIPLTAGFWGKFLVFGAAATGGYLWLAIVAVIGSVVSFGYYGGVLRSAFLDDAPPTRPASVPGPSGARAIGPAGVATVVVAVAIVLIGALPLVTGLAPSGLLR